MVSRLDFLSSVSSVLTSRLHQNNNQPECCCCCGTQRSTAAAANHVTSSVVLCTLRSAGDAIRFHASRDDGRESVNTHVEATEEGRRLLTRRTPTATTSGRLRLNRATHRYNGSSSSSSSGRLLATLTVLLCLFSCGECATVYKCIKKNQSFIINDEDDADAIKQLADTSASASVIISQTTTTPTPPPPPPFPFLNVFLV